MATYSFPITPDLLCIGLFCHDLHKGKYILGGTASYTSLMANQLGKKTAVLTSVGKDFIYLDLFRDNGIEVCVKPADTTTVFKNIYKNEVRTQYIYSRSETMSLNDLPDNWKKAPIVKFCLIADEVDSSLLNAFPNALVGATIQGLLRQWDEKGKITPKRINWEILKPIDLIFMSDADVEDLDKDLPEIIKQVGMVVMTKGAYGAAVFFKNKKFEYPSFPIEEVDPTGAGDIFATAFLLKYHKTNDIELSAAYAHSAASLVVEQVGVRVPTVQRIEERFTAYKQRFL